MSDCPSGRKFLDSTRTGELCSRNGRDIVSKNHLTLLVKLRGALSNPYVFTSSTASLLAQIIGSTSSRLRHWAALAKHYDVSELCAPAEDGVMTYGVYSAHETSGFQSANMPLGLSFHAQTCTS
jgi:hypothetical protein